MTLSEKIIGEFRNHNPTNEYTYKKAFLDTYMNRTGVTITTVYKQFKKVQHLFVENKVGTAVFIKLEEKNMEGQKVIRYKVNNNTESMHLLVTLKLRLNQLTKEVGILEEKISQEQLSHEYFLESKGLILFRRKKEGKLASVRLPIELWKYIINNHDDLVELLSTPEVKKAARYYS